MLLDIKTSILLTSIHNILEEMTRYLKLSPKYEASYCIVQDYYVSSIMSNHRLK